MTPKILSGRPPNFAAIAAAFPLAARDKTYFAYGDTIYKSLNGDVPDWIVAHETVHLKRQYFYGGADKWWDRYLTDPVFRYYEELLAHVAEYRAQLGASPNRQQRRGLLKSTAKRLAAPLYRYNKTISRAILDIRAEVGEDT